MSASEVLGISYTSLAYANLLVGPPDQPRISRSTQVYSQEALWYTGNEEGEQALYDLGPPAELATGKMDEI